MLAPGRSTVLNPKRAPRPGDSLPTLKVTGFEPVFFKMKRAVEPRGSDFGEIVTFESVIVTWIGTKTEGLVVLADADAPEIPRKEPRT